MAPTKRSSRSRSVLDVLIGLAVLAASGVSTPAQGDVPDASSLAPTSTATALASSQYEPRRLAVDAANVYWTAGGKLLAVAKAGGAAREVTAPVAAGAIATDGAFVFWNDQTKGTIMKAPVAGGPAIVVAKEQHQPSSVAVDGANVYWANAKLGGDGFAEVARAPKAGGAVALITADQNEPFFVRVDDAKVYWLADEGAGDLWSAPKTATWVRQERGKPKPPSPAATLLKRRVIDYVADSSGLVWIEKNGVMTLARGTSTPATIAAVQNGQYVAADRTRVFVTTRDAVVMIPRAGGAVTTIASGLDQPAEIVSDGTAVYWITKGKRTDADGIDEGSPAREDCPDAGAPGGPRPVCVTRGSRGGWAHRRGTISRLVP